MPENKSDTSSQKPFGQAILRGELTKKRMSIIFFPILFMQITCWAIARALYPGEGGYLMNYLHISRQGNLVMNPVGAWFFIVSTAITGILLVFYFIFLYRRLMPACKILTCFFLFLGVVGGIGLSLVGIFSEDGGETIQLLHNIGSACAFGGLGGAAFFSLFIMIVRMVQKLPWPTISQFIGVFALAFHFSIMFLFTEGSVMQWTGFYIIFVWVVGMFMIAPETPDSDK